VTNYHGDHVFGVSPFKDVEIFAYKSQLELIDKQMKEEWSKKAFEEWKKEEIFRFFSSFHIVLPIF